MNTSEMKENRYEYLKSLVTLTRIAPDDVCYVSSTRMYIWTKKKPGSRANKFHCPEIKIMAAVMSSGVVHHVCSEDTLNASEFLDQTVSNIGHLPTFVFHPAVLDQSTEWIGCHDVNSLVLPLHSRQIDPCEYAFEQWTSLCRHVVSASQDVIAATADKDVPHEERVNRRLELLKRAVTEGVNSLTTESMSFVYKANIIGLACAYNLDI